MTKPTMRNWKVAVATLAVSIPITILAISYDSITATNWFQVGAGTNSIVGYQSMAVGTEISVSGDNAMAVGKYLISYDNESLVVGEYNAQPATPAYFIIGNGTSAAPQDRNNLLEVRKNGEVVIDVPQGDVSMGPYQ